MRGRPLTTEDIKGILNQYYNMKKSAKTIAKEMDRTESSIRNILHRYKSMTPEKNDININAPAETIQKINEILKRDEPKETPVVKEAATTPEKKLSPRDMIRELYNLGYRIKDNMLVVLVPQPVKLNDIING